MIFDTALEMVLRHEGRHDDDPADPGDDTWYGISRRAHPDMPWPPSLEDARAFYGDLWERTGCPQLPPRVAVVYFDACVNHGEQPGTPAVPGAPRLLQKALLVTGPDRIVLDGVVGPKTLAAARRADEMVLAEALLTERALRYAQITTFEHFGRGWMARLFSCHRTALRMETP